jgi:hypothetical protein
VTRPYVLAAGFSDSCSYRSALGISEASEVSIFVYLRKLSEEQSRELFRVLIYR